MTTFAWAFEVLDVIPVSLAVESMHWRITADDGLGHYATAIGETKAGPVDPQNFIPYADLTLPVVQGWCETQMGGELDAIKAWLVGQINDQANPQTVAMAPPW